MTRLNFNRTTLKKALGAIAFLYFPIIMILVWIKIQNKVPIYYLTLDPIAIGNKPFYTGFLSNIGILFWCATTTICWFCFGLLVELQQSKKIQLFFLASGALTALLLFDDLFVLHSIGIPKYLKISQENVIFIYLLLVLGYILYFQQIIRSQETITFVFSLIFFVLSIGFDKELIPVPNHWVENGNNLLLEDGFKILGIISWFCYFLQGGITEIKKVFLNQSTLKT